MVTRRNCGGHFVECSDCARCSFPQWHCCAYKLPFHLLHCQSRPWINCWNVDIQLPTQDNNNNNNNRRDCCQYSGWLVFTLVSSNRWRCCRSCCPGRKPITQIFLAATHLNHWHLRRWVHWTHPVWLLWQNLAAVHQNPPTTHSPTRDSFPFPTSVSRCSKV